MSRVERDAMYDALARWQWRRRRDASSDVAIELRKRLRPRAAADATGPVDGGAGLDHWLRSLAEWRGGERVLDLGCGFGASSLRAAAAGARACFGVTPSRFQVAKAQELAAARGLAAVCTFAAAEFEQAPAGPFDVVFAIESLAHAEDLAAALRAVRARLAPTGVLLWLDDRRVEVEGNAVDPDVRELAECWASPPLPDSSTARAALAVAGLQLVREVDLTDRVPFVPPGKNRWRRTVLRGLGAIAPTASWRAVLRAFRGGLALERLYARGACRYLLWMARPFDPTA